MQLSDYGNDDLIAIEFYLDDCTRTRVWKTAYVRNINPRGIGAEFADSKLIDQAIGAFIWGQRAVQMDTK